MARSTGPVPIRRDPFGRATLMRQKVDDGACAWCGSRGRRWEYWWHGDMSSAKVLPAPQAFCGISCHRMYYGG